LDWTSNPVFYSIELFETMDLYRIYPI